MKKFHLVSARLMLFSFFVLAFIFTVDISYIFMILGLFMNSAVMGWHYLLPGVYIAMFGAVIALILFIVGFVMSFFEKPKDCDKKEVPKKENETGK